MEDPNDKQEEQHVELEYPVILSSHTDAYTLVFMKTKMCVVCEEGCFDLFD